MRKRSSRPPPDLAGGRQSALRLLSRREHSAAELRHKLARRGHDDEQAQSIVDELGAAGWQSDARYAEMLVRNRAAQGYGPLRIRAEMEAARIDSAQILAALDAAEVDWGERIRAIHRRRFDSLPGDAAGWQKQYRFLAGRGFSAEQIRAVLRDAPEDPDGP